MLVVSAGWLCLEGIVMEGDTGGDKDPAVSDPHPKANN